MLPRRGRPICARVDRWRLLLLSRSLLSAQCGRLVRLGRFLRGLGVSLIMRQRYTSLIHPPAIRECAMGWVGLTALEAAAAHQEKQFVGVTSDSQVEVERKHDGRLWLPSHRGS